MVPGAAHRIADHKTVDERTVIMRAMSPDREHVRSVADEQNFLPADMADHRFAIRERGESNAFGQVSAGLGLILRHGGVLRSGAPTSMCSALGLAGRNARIIEPC